MTPLVCVHRTPGSVYAEASTHGALCTLGNPVPARSTAGLTAIMTGGLVADRMANAGP
jgi:hypothetical protein